jgi:hypothetical protein
VRPWRERDRASMAAGMLGLGLGAMGTQSAAWHGHTARNPLMTRSGSSATRSGTTHRMMPQPSKCRCSSVDGSSSGAHPRENRPEMLKTAELSAAGQTPIDGGHG